MGHFLINRKCLLLLVVYTLFSTIAFHSCSKAQSLIDTGFVNTNFDLSWKVDTSITDVIDNVPMFSPLLGTQVSATLSGPLLFSWPQALYSVDHNTLPGPEPIATENVNITLYTSDYLKGASNYNNSFVGESIYCTSSPQCPGFSIPNTAGSGSLGNIEESGTSIPVFDGLYRKTTSIKAYLSSNFEGQGSFVASDNYKLSGAIGVDVKYTSFSTSHYVAEAIDNSSGATAIPLGLNLKPSY